MRTMHRFLGEDPWERQKILKKYIRKTPFTMLLRGQNLVGYRNYPDDVVRAFVDKSCEVGIDIVDTCLAPYALRTSMPAVEPLVVSLQGTKRDTGLDVRKLIPLGESYREDRRSRQER